MTGEASWIPIVMMLLAGCALMALGVGSRFWNRDLRSEQRRMVCPKCGREVLCEPVQNTKTGEWTGIVRCSEFNDPEDVRCSRSCLEQLEPGPGAQHGLGTPASMKV